MEQRWLIIADDLTGAADSAIAFARRRLPARVTWGEPRPEDRGTEFALAFDADTRQMPAAAGARRHQEILQRLFAGRGYVFKKIDSTLRGNPAEEIGALCDLLAARTPRFRAVFTPAFPAGGRVTRGGRVFVHGVPLERTEFWSAARPREHADLAQLLEAAGLHTRHVSLDVVRGGAARLGAELEQAQGAAAVSICDAETEADLERIAAAALDGGAATLFAGSAGFAHALAARESRHAHARSSPLACAASACGALFVVGSLARPSRAALATLRQMPGVRSVSVAAGMLLRATAQGDGALPLHDLEAELAAGVDVVVDIQPPTDASAPILPALVDALARRIAPLATRASALMVTGGDTAAALLARCGVRGIRLADELEPGASLGLTLGELSLPIVTKSGGFGDDGSLCRIAERLRFIRKTGTVA